MTSFSDDFNRADGDPGAGWVQVSGTWSIVSNQLSPGSSGATIIIRPATSMATSDNYAQVTIAATTAVSQGVMCRSDSTGANGYLLRNNGSNWGLFKAVSGTFTAIGTTYTAAAAAGDVAKIQAVGSTIKGFVNGVERISVVDTSVTSGTNTGIRSQSTSGLRYDDFSAADVGASYTGDAALSGTATVTATGVRATGGDAAQAAAAGLSASGQLAAAGAASEAATASLSASGAAGFAGAGSLAGVAGLSADGSVRLAITGQASLQVTAQLSAAGSAGLVGPANAAATAGLSAAGGKGSSGGAALTASAVLQASGLVAAALVPGTARPGVVAAPTASGGRVMAPTASGGSS